MSEAGSPLHVRSDQVEVSVVGDRLVLYHRGTRAALVLNVSGSRLWERLATPASTADLVVALQERFPGLAAERAREDVSAFVSELTRHGAIVPGR